MRARFALALCAAILASGCNLLIDPDRYRGVRGDDGGPDDEDAGADAAGGEDAPVADSDAGPMEPTVVLEGEGAGTGSAPVVIVLTGSFAPDTSVRVGDPDVTIEPAVVSTDGTMVAVAARFAVDGALADGDTVALPVVVTQGGDEIAVGELLVDGLDEASLSGAIDGSGLRVRYSQVSVTDDAFGAGTSAIRLRATADISVAGGLDLNGALGGAAVAGGCSGGGAGVGGQCSIAGGGPGGTSGTSGTGGGGGGHATMGSPGAGGGGGGQASGGAMLTPLAAEAGNGGGGGAAGTLGAGGAGGGGGGIIELSAGGTVTIDGVLSADGGVGANGGGAVAATAGGSGGGGSGGALLVRGTSVVGGGSLSAQGAAGGNTFNVGGAGAEGRIRVDVASAALSGMSIDPAPTRGPRWADDTPYIVRDAAFEATLYGEANTSFAATQDGGDPEQVDTDETGVGTYSVTLERGRNRLCALVSMNANQLLNEATQCVYITYVP